MSGAEFLHVYDLEKDREYVERVQAATVQGGEFALRIDHGLFGTDPWWAAIRNGDVPTERLEGTIVQLYKTGEWPEFAVEVDGQRSSWAMDGEVGRYRVGKGVRIEFMTAEYRKPPPEADASTRVVLGIWVEP